MSYAKFFPANPSNNVINVCTCSRTRDEKATPVVSGIGVWFGLKFTKTEHLSEKIDDYENTALRSEILSGIRALEQSLVHYAVDVEGHNIGEIIIQSDSARLVDAATHWLRIWQPDYMLTEDRVMDDKRFYERLAELIGIFHVQGIKVLFSKVGEMNNHQAAALARAAITRPLPCSHLTNAWIVEPYGLSICHQRELFTTYEPTLLSEIFHLDTLSPSGYITLGRGTVELNVTRCNGTEYKLVKKNVLHVPSANVNVFAPSHPRFLRPGFLIHDGEAIALIQDPGNSQTVLKCAVGDGPRSLYHPSTPLHNRWVVRSKFAFLRADHVPPPLPPIPTRPFAQAYKKVDWL